MLTSEEFRDWCIKLDLNEQTIQEISQIRSSPPSRRVQSRRGNVSGRYPSQKMGMTIQFESHHHELAGIYAMEYDSEVLEYYDQPPTIKLNYESASGRQVGVKHTPDFFEIGRRSAGWSEWKTTQELEQLAIKMPNRYQEIETGQWRCPPGESYAQDRGLKYLVRTEKEIDWNLQRNLYFLEDYFRDKIKQSIPSSNQQKIIGLVETQPGITLSKLIEWGLNSDEIYRLIASQQLYVNLSGADLASEPEKVQLFLSVKNATAVSQLSQSRSSKEKIVTTQEQINPTVGSQIIWDEINWRVLNLGATEITLLNSQQEVVNLPVTVFEQLIAQKQIIVANTISSNPAPQDSKIRNASESDCAEANRRYRIIAPYLTGSSPRDKSVPKRTFYRWVKNWRQAEQIYGYGYLGLLPQSHLKGNRKSKIPELTQKLMAEYIVNDYETYKQKSKRAVYGALVNACEKENTAVPSYKTFLKFCNNRPTYEQTKKRQGSRSAYSNEPFYWELEFTTPRHGDRPWAICHLDHTQLDIELVSSSTKALLGRPWVTFLSDAYSRRILAFHLTFDAPSYRSCMMVIRDCVSRHGRLPQCLVVDGGKEFSSVYFERLLAMYECISKTRPGAKPRYRSKLKKSKPYQRNVGSKNSHLSTLREQVIVNMRHRELVVFLTDEAQRFSKLASSSRQQIQMDALQSMASMTNTLHGLFGTYELLEFRNLSGQLSRRSIDIHFPRYQADCSDDLVEFQRVLKSFGEKMTLEKAPELENHWEYFYERSIGCVGILKDWLTQAYRKALDESASTLREHHWQSYAPSVAKCLQIAAEAIEGEKAFQFESGEMSLLQQKLG